MTSTKTKKRKNGTSAKPTESKKQKVSKGEVTITDPLGNKIIPLKSFKEARKLFHKSSKILFKTTLKKFETPTPVQAYSWPGLSDKTNRDFIGISKTGSGKTLAFTLPIICKILKEIYKREKKNNLYRPQNKAVASPSCLVLSPTRELAIQSQLVAKELVESSGNKLNSIVIYGGGDRRQQERDLKASVSKEHLFCVATIGRFLDFLNSGTLNLSRTKWLILDEADRLLEQGFEKEVKSIIEQIPNPVQTLMFSATWPEEIRKIASAYMSDPIKLTVGSDSLTANQNVAQNILVLEEYDKNRKLFELLSVLKARETNKKIIVFALYKKEASRLEETLQRQRYRAIGIHGDKQQKEREDCLRSFLTGKNNVLVATDVASRGLDIEDVEVVINYTFPLTIEDYVHRIGRTGRAGKKGRSFTFFTAKEKSLAGSLQNILREAKAAIPEELAKFGNSVKKKTHGLYGAHFRGNDEVETMKKSTHIKF
eukprot:snap_masked-scaffold_3-processed-gene-14.20-mRNA-1 protein AED:0.29 eAED:0.29 QI:0/-1/0/1/-1/1/1/0/482